MGISPTLGVDTTTTPIFHILPLRDVVGIECDLVKLQMLNYLYVAIITDPRFDASLLILVERFPVSMTSWLKQNP